MNEQITNVITKSKSIFSWIGRNLILLGFIICVIIITILYFQNKSIKKQNDIQKVELMMLTDTVKNYKTKAGDWYGKFNSVTVESNASKKSLAEANISITELKARGIKASNVISALQEQLAFSGSFVTPIIDTTVNHPTTSAPQPANYFKWTNNFLSLNGMILNKKLEMDYSYKSGIKHITEQIGKKTIVTVYLDDPNAKVLTGSQIIIVPTKHWWDHWYYYSLAGFAAGVFIVK